MQQIYTIPVNEAFDDVIEHKEVGCPLCQLYRKLQNNELDIILGASMMEPDIRIKTNELGFCLNHYGMMMRRQRMLGIGLMLESHLDEIMGKVTPKTLLNKAGVSISALTKQEESCYVCSRIDNNMDNMIATTAYLFESDSEFLAKYKKAPYFCLPHYRKLIEYASKKMNKKQFADFYEVTHGIVETYLKSLRGDVSWFCKKFDYRYDQEPWYNSKDSIQRSIKFLSGEPGYNE